MSISSVDIPRTARPWNRRVMHIVRRAHLYLGLLLLPWAVLYGMTAFLFNHPTAFSDVPTTTFGASELFGTSMERTLTPAEVATQVVFALCERADRPGEYSLIEPNAARYTRDFAFVTVKAETVTLSMLFDVKNGGGTIRQQAPLPVETRHPVEKVPFAVPGLTVSRPESRKDPQGDRAVERHAADVLKIADPLPERIKDSVPTILQRAGFPGGSVTVTSVPDLSFRMRDAAGKVWRVTFNALKGSVDGRPADERTEEREPLSARQFLLRLHTAHGYPGETNTRWFWAVIVDVMAGVMIFWGVSGLFMWWQIKATRIWGVTALLLSAVIAILLAIGMHSILTN